MHLRTTIAILLVTLLSSLAPAPDNPGPKDSTSDGWVAFDSFEYRGIDRLADQHPPGPGEFRNPVLAGWYSDPSICRVGPDYYLITSTFAYFPGIPVFHSRDLVHWRQIGHVLDRPSQSPFGAIGTSSGIFAPAISHHAGLFYVVTTATYGIGNFVVTAKDPAGPWSDPVRLPEVKGIDPSLFFDDDGKAYLVHNGDPPGASEYPGHYAIRLLEFDPVTLKTVGPPVVLVNGGTDISKKPVWIEGPHLYKKDGWYILTASEGGTGPAHCQVVFRSRDVRGPYVPGPIYPILTQRHLPRDRPNPIECTGHADLVDSVTGQWYAVFLGTRPYEHGYSNLGRETFLAKVDWNDGWPAVVGGNDPIPGVAPAPALPQEPPTTSPATGSPTTALPTTGSFDWHDDFSSSKLALPWMMLRTPRESWYSLTVRPGYLLLKPRSESLADRANPSFLARRQQHDVFIATTTIDLTRPVAVCQAGLALYNNEGHYLFFALNLSGNEVHSAFLERRSRKEGIEEPTRPIIRDIHAPARRLQLRAQVDRMLLSFSYRLDDDPWTTLADKVDGKLLTGRVGGGFVGATLGPHVRLAPAQADPTTRPAR